VIGGFGILEFAFWNFSTPRREEERKAATSILDFGICFLTTHSDRVQQNITHMGIRNWDFVIREILDFGIGFLEFFHAKARRRTQSRYFNFGFWNLFFGIYFLMTVPN
jgi:hypothetical protein